MIVPHEIRTAKINQEIYDVISDNFRGPGNQEFLGTKAANQILQAAGYGGITHIGSQISSGKPHRVYIAFDPKQVVSVFGP